MKKTNLVLLLLIVLISCKKESTKPEITVSKQEKEVATKLVSTPLPETFAIDKLNFYQPTNNLKIVTLMPSLYVDCEYASMLTTSLQHYFVKGLSFSTEEKPNIDVILLVNDKNKWQGKAEELNRNKTDNMLVYYDENGSIFKSLGISPIKDTIDESMNNSMDTENIEAIKNEIQLTRNGSAILYLLDENNNVLYKDDSYRGEGKDLKPLDVAIKNHLSINIKPYTATQYEKIKVGDKAPAFTLVGPENPNNQPISYKDNKVNIITFYPAAFTGTIAPDKTINISKSSAPTPMTCASQLSLFDTKLYTDNVKIYAISSSTNPILALWKEHLESTHVSYLNDENYQISKQFKAYNHANNFNNRVTYIIDNKGTVRYIDEEFMFDDQEALVEEIKKVM